MVGYWRYQEHVDQIARAMTQAIAFVQDSEPNFAMDLYVTGVMTDGQFATVQVGVSNVSDYEVEVDTNTGHVLTCEKS